MILKENHMDLQKLNVILLVLDHSINDSPSRTVHYTDVYRLMVDNWMTIEYSDQ